MNPFLPLLLCGCLIFWLFRLDGKWRQGTSRALLIPGTWLAILCSRPVSYWFAYGGDADSDGNPINTLIFASLLIAAIAVLVKRRFKWIGFISRNKALLFIYFFMGISIFWSDLPLVSLKRLLKDFGCVLSALVILTEAVPTAAIRTVFVRVSYLIIPLSIIVGKYFPMIGRNYGVGGEPMFTGLTTQKNTLGQVVCVCALMILWDLLEILKCGSSKQFRLQVRIRIFMLLLAGWLLIHCGSQTSLVCLVLGVVTFWGTGHLLRMSNGRQILLGCLALAIGVAAVDKTFNISDIVIQALGRNPTLTGRTAIWSTILKQEIDPIFGVGFYSFWDTFRGEAVVRAIARIKTAHNGYLEIYMDGGFIALALLGIMLVSCGRRGINRLFGGESLGKMSLIFWLLAIIFNLSESNYLRLTPLWFTFLVVTLECPSALHRTLKTHDAGNNRRPRQISKTAYNPQTQSNFYILC